MRCDLGFLRVASLWGICSHPAWAAGRCGRWRQGGRRSPPRAVGRPLRTSRSRAANATSQRPCPSSRCGAGPTLRASSTREQLPLEDDPFGVVSTRKGAIPPKWASGRSSDLVGCGSHFRCGLMSDAAHLAPGGEDRAAFSGWVETAGVLRDAMDQPAEVSPKGVSVISPQVDNQLTQVRLGIANSLHAALALKDPARAAHTLRVALSSSAWAFARGLSSNQRDALEVAALLHDVGVIGVPDRILQKPGPLDVDESRIVEQIRTMTVAVLRRACAVPEVLQIVAHVGAWYDGSRPGFSASGQQIPLAARMITVVEAYDAMTSDHVSRPAMSREMALAELFGCSGTQFDAELVRQFVELDCCDRPALRREVAGRWLRTLDPDRANRHWLLTPTTAPASPEEPHLFHVQLLDHMYDGVVFVDTNLLVTQWNRGAERLTGIPGTAMRGRRWMADLIGMRNERGKPIGEENCPVFSAVQSGVQSLRRLTITGRNGRTVAVDSHTIPVTSDDGQVLGAVLLLHDASPQTSLEHRCQTLDEKAKRDPLTQVANRAEFDRHHAAFVARYREQRVTFSLIICDLDHFKQVNDTYGHQAGDETIKSLASLLKRAAHPEDVVARYGGEEFVMLCSGCDNATATARAEQVCRTLARTPQPKLGGRSVTASFGVTEVQPGDTPESMLRRADRALLAAKAKGRNMVIQLGAGSNFQPAAPAAPPDKQRPAPAVEAWLVTAVPVRIAVEKLRGFIADHQAKVLSIEGNRVRLLLNEQVGLLRRRSDRPMKFLTEIEFEEETISRNSDSRLEAAPVSRTWIHVTVRPKRHRDRRRAHAAERTREVLLSLRSYLIATEAQPTAESSVSHKTFPALAQWLADP
ncbi:MAG TPA: diguanylate cyclase [Planctomycetaceae bacterium]|nr:diguanylate cyclase [Planctomycetaceae bacterium]